MLWSKWKAGPQADVSGRVLVSFTDFTANGFLDLPGAVRAGFALRAAWPRMPGAVGMWLWTAPLQKRCGSLSVWTDEAALRAFVRTPAHVAIVRAYRGRGTMHSRMWSVDASLHRSELRDLAEEDMSLPPNRNCCPSDASSAAMHRRVGGPAFVRDDLPPRPGGAAPVTSFQTPASASQATGHDRDA